MEIKLTHQSNQKVLKLSVKQLKHIRPKNKHLKFYFLNDSKFEITPQSEKDLQEIQLQIRQLYIRGFLLDKNKLSFIQNNIAEEEVKINKELFNVKIRLDNLSILLTNKERLNDIILIESMTHYTSQLRIKNHSPVLIIDGKKFIMNFENVFFKKLFIKTFYAIKISKIKRENTLQFKIVLNTWNFGLQKINENQFTYLDELDADIIGISLQEGPSEQIKLEMIQQMKKRDFYLVKSGILWRTMLLVFAKTSIQSLITNQKILLKTTGFGNIIRNKGAISIFFQLLHKDVLITGSHLTAFADENYNKMRIKSVYKILRDVEEWTIEKNRKIDFQFFLGDLNFRLQCKVISKF